MNREIKELLIAQKLKSGQKLTDEELALYAVMSEGKKQVTESQKRYQEQ